MPLETATYISQLVSSNPAHTDGLNQADSHMRLIKSVLQSSFPQVAGAAAISDVQLSALGTALAAKQSMVPTGAIMPFLLGTSDPNWLRCNGGTFAFSTYPALGTYLGFVSGTCTLPNLEDTGRFLRSVSSAQGFGTGGVTQANQFASHTHTASETSAGAHTHPGSTASSSSSSTTTITDPGHNHAIHGGGTSNIVASQAGGAFFGAGQANLLGATDSNTTGITASTTTTTTTTVSLASDGSHTHTITVNAAGVGTETRPEAMTAIYYIHI